MLKLRYIFSLKVPCLWGQMGRRLGRVLRVPRTVSFHKLLVALLVEKLVRHALTISPWGYDVATGTHSQPVA